MKWFSIFDLIFIISFIELIKGARLARNCNGKFQQWPRCYKDGVARGGERDSSFPIPNDGQKRRIETNVDNCFRKQFFCTSSPIPSAPETKARSDCYNQIKKSLISQFQQCARTSISDFNMPDDPYDPTNDWAYRVTSVQAVLNSLFLPQCKGVKKADLQTCVNNAGYNFKNRPPFKVTTYACQADADCRYNWGLDCQNTWDYQVQPVLCQCSQDMQKNKVVQNVQNQYKQCMSGKGVTVPKDDPVLKWIDTFIKGQCMSSQNNPCKREREAASKRSSIG